ncbi:MAG: inositol monophosphatase family protein [bacterium]
MADVSEKDLQILIKAAHAGGEVLRKYFGQTLDLVEKSTVADFQTKADLESEQSILKILKAEFPRYNILSEEEGETNKNSEYTLVIDPLDGTNNFVLGIPHFSVSIALLYKNEAVLGVVYQPIIDQTFSAAKNGGAYLNGNKIKVGDVTDPKKLNIVFTFGYKAKHEYRAAVMYALYNAGCKRIMNNWSGAFELCMFASGKIESIFSDGIELHDFAAGKLIALEAGAKVIGFDGKPEKDYTNSKFIISNTDEVNKYILNIIAPLQKGR